MKNSILKYVAMGSVCIILSACSLGHKNPLTKMDDDTVSKFLVDASHYAEMKMGKDYRNYGFSYCMDKKLNNKICQTLYAYVLQFAKAKDPFKTLTLSDLTDINVWRKIYDDYDNFAFTYIPPELLRQSLLGKG